MLAEIVNGYKSFSTTEIFQNINFQLKAREKVAVIGHNGTGKTTLLRVLIGLEQLDAGECYLSRQLSCGYLAQTTSLNESVTVKDYLLAAFKDLLVLEQQLKQLEVSISQQQEPRDLARYSQLLTNYEQAGGYQYEVKLKTLFTKFGFAETELTRFLPSFSGGEQTKLAFIRLLLEEPELLLLDEPTNHLDLETIIWLETYLKQYPGAIVVISHDRAFINHVTTIIYELENQQLFKYHGDYAAYKQQKATMITNTAKLYQAQQAELAKAEEFIERNRAKQSKAKQVKSKIKQLEKLDKITLVKPAEQNLKFKFKQQLKGGKKVLEVAELVFGYNKPLGQVSFTLYQGSRLGIIGANGIGKSTLLKTLAQKLPALAGSYRLGHQISVGYFEQQAAQKKQTSSILDYLWRAYPDYTTTEIRGALASLGFTQEAVHKSLDVCSGGELVRLALLKLMLAGDNLLLLDEPTNHLDLAAKDSFEAALLNTSLTLIFVSHDRYFIEQLATELLIFQADGVIHFPGNYCDYLASQVDTTSEPVSVKKTTPTRVKRSLGKLERQITIKENQLKQLKELMFDEAYYLDYTKLANLEKEIASTEQELANLYLDWEKDHSN